MKYLEAFFIFLSSIIVAIIPLQMKKDISLKSSIKYCNALTNGLFLGIALTHFLPEAIHNLEDYDPNKPIILVFLVMAVSIFLISIFEYISRKMAAKNFIHQSWTSYLVLVILSIHSITEGLVLGLETNPNYETTIFIVIIAHKTIETFSLVMNMIRNNIVMNKIIAALLFFSITTPIGIIIGKFFLDIDVFQQNSHIRAYFDAIAAGTFIYIALSHKTNIPKYVNLLLILAGFSLMTLLGFVLQSWR